MTDFSNESLSIDVGDGVIVVAGDIDMASGPLLEAAILEQEDVRPIVIDLGAVTFIDSSGLRSLLDAARRAHSRGTEVVLQALSPEVARLLDITGTVGQFTIAGSRA